MSGSWNGQIHCNVMMTTYGFLLDLSLSSFYFLFFYFGGLKGLDSAKYRRAYQLLDFQTFYLNRNEKQIEKHNLLLVIFNYCIL